MSYKFEVKGITCNRKYDYWVGGRSLNSAIIKAFEEKYTVMGLNERNSFLMKAKERTHKGHFEDFYKNLKDYSYNEVLNIAIDSKIKRLQKNNQLGIRLLNYYEVKYITAQSDTHDDVLYAFLIKKTHLNFFNEIIYSREDKKFIVKNEDRDWSFDCDLIEKLDFY